MVCTEQERSLIYEQYSGKILAYIKSRITNHYTAEDLCSDVFLKVYQKLDTFDETKASLSTWIYTITRNTLTDYYRTNHIAEETPETMADGTSIEDDVCKNEMLETLADALEKLEERERSLIVYRYYSGMTLKEAAEKLGISYSYTKLLHNKALKELQNFF